MRGINVTFCVRLFSGSRRCSLEIWFRTIAPQNSYISPMSLHRGDPHRHIRVLNNLFNKKSVYSDLIFSRFEWENYYRFFKISPLPCAKFSKEKSVCV